MAATTLQCADAVWARFLGCSPSHLASGGATAVVRTLPTHGGIEVFFPAAAGCVVSLPPGIAATLREAVAPKGSISSHAEVVERVQRSFADRMERMIGPGYLGYADAGSFLPAQLSGRSMTIRQLTEADRSTLDHFASECPAEEWAASGVNLDHPPVFGSLLNEGQQGSSSTIVAAGKLQQLPPDSQNVQHIGIVTHPRFRGRGYGKALVSAMCRHALGEGAVLQYRTLLSNTPSVAIAHSLGFVDYATTYAFRLRG